MGSSHSQPQRPAAARQGATRDVPASPTPSPAPAASVSSAGPARRRSILGARFPSLFRGESRSKRTLPHSPRHSSVAAHKRRRVHRASSEASDSGDNVAVSSTLALSPSATMPTAPPDSGLPIADIVRSSLSSPSSSHDSAVSPVYSPPLDDALLDERMQSLASIRDALGPEWPPTSTASAGMDRLLQRFRRPAPTPQQAASSASLPTRSRSNRFSALFGTSNSGGNTSSRSLPDGVIDGVQSTTDEAADASAATRHDRSSSDRATPGTDDRSARRIPVGAVLVIQGLAQTQREDGSVTSSSNGETPQSIDGQARVIGQLLTVAAAATAATLLAPDAVPPSGPRGPGNSALASIIDRLRPNRSSRQRSVEAALGEYLRTVLRDNRHGPPPGLFSDVSSPDVAEGFESFLEGLQGDLVRAIGQYALPAIPGGEADTSLPATTAGDTAAESDDQREQSAEDTSVEQTDQATPASGSGGASEALDAPTPIPTFHEQAGQIQPSSNSLGVVGGTDGSPRRLNFFRAHLFPSVAGGPADAPDAHAIVPSIFVGVRSVSHDASMTTEDLVQHPSFPFNDGHVPSDEDATGAAPAPAASPPDHLASALPTVEPRRTLRERAERVLDRFQSSRRERQAAPAVNTYLVYVIGGNYPRSHPILAIPNLITGGPLSDEDMALVAELLGAVKPPTASKEEIEQSGLQVVKGAEIGPLVTAEHVLSNCLDRCLICLSDYEADEDCRVLTCRHAFHKDCVDHWLEQGRNNCPACRSTAVAKPDMEPAAAPTAGLGLAAGDEEMEGAARR